MESIWESESGSLAEGQEERGWLDILPRYNQLKERDCELSRWM